MNYDVEAGSHDHSVPVWARQPINSILGQMWKVEKATHAQCKGSVKNTVTVPLQGYGC